jgi:outer membrane murein-binding lipoprotein Lpp
VAHRFDDIDYETPREPRRRRWVSIAVAAGLAMLGVASALLWRTYSDSIPALPSFASVAAPGAASPADPADKAVGFKDLQALQQQIAGSLQSSAQLVAAQQAEIKRLSDQVSTLNAKIDALSRPAASAQAAVPAAPPPAAPAPRKKPAAARPAPGISVGGAPLPPPVPSSR